MRNNDFQQRIPVLLTAFLAFMLRRRKAELSRTQWEALIDRWVLNERNRKLMKRRICDGITFGRLAEEFDLSEQHTKTIFYSNRDLILRHI